MRKFIFFLIVILFYLETVLATTSFEPEKLSQVFEWRYEEDGTALQLYQTVRGQQLVLGNLSGTITAEPPINVRVRNGKYSIIHDDVAFTAEGDFIVTKPLQNKDYPTITLLNGSIESLGMQFSCGQQCRTIFIDADTMNMNLDGEAIVIGRSRNVNITIKNVDFMPELSENADIGFEFETDITTNTEEDSEIIIGNFVLEKGSNGKYSAKEHDISDLTIETITGKINILDVINVRNQWLVHDGRNDITLNYGREGIERDRLLTIQSGGPIIYGNERVYRICVRSEDGCFNVNPETGEIKINLWRGPDSIEPKIARVNLDNPVVSKLTLTLFNTNDLQSRLIAEKPSLGRNRKMVFTRSNVIVDGNWVDFGVSFSTSLYNVRDGRYDLLECKIAEQRCYLNGVLVNLERLQEARCNKDEDCSRGVCVSNRCIEARGCTQIIESQSPDAIDVLFVGEGMASLQEVQQFTVNLLEKENGFYQTEPFKSNRDKFNIWIKSSPPTGLGPFGGVNEEQIDFTDCPEAEVRVVMSKKEFRSSGNNFLCRLSLTIFQDDSRRNRLFLHEFGHCFGRLSDEYHVVSTSQGNPHPPNCIAPNRDKTGEEMARNIWGRLIGDSRAKKLAENAQKEWKGCGGDCDIRCSEYLRPSENSIMRHYSTTENMAGEFNEISRLWLERKINRQNFDDILEILAGG